MTGRSIDIGNGHSYRFVRGDLGSFPNLFPADVEDDDGHLYGIVGIIEVHKKSNGELCEGSAPFCSPLRPSKYEVNQPIWKVQSLRPLTISPSLQCSVCPSHGFIREDRWIDA